MKPQRLGGEAASRDGDQLRERRHGGRCGSRVSWHVDATYLKVRGRWCYLYRAIDRHGNLIDAMLIAHRDTKAAKTFFRSARASMGFRPEWVTTDGHGCYPRAIRSVLGRTVRQRIGACLNNRLEQDHRGIKGRSDAGAASRTVTPPITSAASIATSSAPGTVTTRSSLLSSAAPASPRQHASRSASCRTRDLPRPPRQGPQRWRET